MRPGQMEKQKTSLKYRPLEESAIRLVSFKKDQGASSPFELRLEHFKAPKIPSYIALSYPWGDPNNLHPVTVNCQDFNVTQNLYKALLHIYEISAIFEEGLGQQSDSGHVNLFLWIDALCINQGDLDERSKQVSRMTAIFASAFTVLVWLGTSEELDSDPLDFEYLLYCLDAMPLLDFPKRALTFPGTPEQRGSGNNIFTLYDIFEKVMLNDWFKRLWVLQEYALSQRKPCAMIGDSLFSLESFYTFGTAISRALWQKMQKAPGISRKDCAESLLSKMEVYTKCILGTTFLENLIASTEFQDKSLASQLLSIIGNQGPKYATVPHDHIYGFLGMVNLAWLPTQLIPNYRLSCGQVYKDYTKFIIENTKDLRVLMFLENTVSGQPSWVNGFLLDTPWHTEPAVRHTGTFSTDGQSLVVEGVRYGKILSFLSGSKGVAGKRTQRSYDAFFSTAAEIRQQPLADIRQEWCDEFAGWVRRVPGDATNRTHNNDPSYDTHGSSALEFDSSCDFALFDNGKVVRCERRQQQGPVGECQVWAFKGSTNLSIVYQERCDKYRYDGWLSKAEVILDEDFFSSYDVERITLI